MEEFPPGANAYDDEIDFTSDAYDAFIDQGNLGGAAAPLPLPQDNVPMTDLGGDELGNFFDMLTDEGSGATPVGGGSVETLNELVAAPAPGPVEPEVGEMAALLVSAAAAALPAAAAPPAAAALPAAAAPIPKKRRVTKFCTVEGCKSAARNNSAGLCKRHGGGKRCAKDDCKRGAEGASNYCKRHGGGRRCALDGCESSAQGATNFCSRHGGGQRCAKDDCKSGAIGGTYFCTRHNPLKRTAGDELNAAFTDLSL